MSIVYKITKQLSGKQSMSASQVKDKQGKILTKEEDQAKRWVEHFKEVLNCPDPPDKATITPSDDDISIDTSPPTLDEIVKAIKTLKNRKAAGIDAIPAELLKSDINTSAKVLYKLFKKIWENEVIPSDWNKGLIVKLPKKGDLQCCDNWRGITLLSVPSKVFCKIILGRIDTAVDLKLREEQAGFRKGRGCIDQIFALRNIIEQCIEWNTPLFINFIDFKKAFDSVHRETLWEILTAYGIPMKFISIIKCFYNNFECNIILETSISDSFEVKSGVRQGCILSPILFLMVIDWIQRNTTSAKNGIQWTMFEQLEDLDFADDLAEISTTQKQLQEKTNKLNTFARKTGLKINVTKTKVMSINQGMTEPITIDDQPVENVEDFTYLGSIISSDNGAKKDIQSRLAKARAAFHRLQPIWKSRNFSINTKLKLYNSNIKSVLLYGSECWRIIQSDIQKVEAFHNSCLRKIHRIFWPNKITNINLLRISKCDSISTQIKQRRFRWLGHVMRMSNKKIPKTALNWTPPGKRKPGRPRTTWRRTIKAELQELGYTWGQAQYMAKDRDLWRKLVGALCPSRDEEDK